MSFLFFYFFVVFVNLPFILCPTVKPSKSDDDSRLTIPEIIRKYGYPLEVHHVTTSDGYILTLHRIPHYHNGSTPKKVSSRVVYLQHGLFGSTADWIIPGPGKGLGYLLADAGYDVWMSNTRGNTFSRRHRILSPTSHKFWDYSWHEIAYYDLPDTIDYILDKTGRKKLFNIGYSQGTTTFYVMAAMRPEYNKKIIAHFSLAPVGYMDHIFSPLVRFLAFWESPVELLFKLTGHWVFQPHNKLLGLVEKYLCKDDSITQILCKNILFALCGYSPEEFNATLFPMIAAYYPAGTSTKQVLHYAQLVRSAKFGFYDYGMLENLMKYKSFIPPEYNLNNIKTPVYMFYSEHDWFSNTTDVNKLCKKLKKYCKAKILVKAKAMNHLDYVFGKNVKQRIYEKLIKLMARYGNPAGSFRSKEKVKSSIANTYGFCNFILFLVSQTINLLLTQW